MAKTIWLMHLRQLRRQPLRAALAVLAIAGGVALMTAVLIARTSLDQSFKQYSSSIGGPADLRVTSRFDHGGIDASLLPALEAVPGVQSLIPLVTTVTEIGDRQGHSRLVAAIGADCRALAIFGGGSACDPAALAARTDTDPPLVGRALIDVATVDGVLRTNVGDRLLRDAVVLPALDQINGGLVAVYPLPVAQQLFARPGGLDVVYVVTTPGADLVALQRDLAAVVGPQNKIGPATQVTDEVAFVSSQLLPILLLISLFGISVGGQLVFNTMSLSLEERRRELAIESALGGSPRLVRGGILTEAAVLGVLGGAAGVVMGVFVAKPFVDNLHQFAEQISGLQLAVHVSAGNVALGLCIGVLTSLLAASIPARRATRLELAQELADRARRPAAAKGIRLRRVVILSILTATGLVLTWIGSRNGSLEPWQPNVLLVGVVLLFVCPFQLGPSLAPFAGRWLPRIPSLQQGPARVAVTNFLSETRRSSAVLMAVGSAVGMAFTISAVTPGMTQAAARLARYSSADRVTVGTLDPNNTGAIDAKISPALQATLAEFPGVARVEHLSHAFVDLAGVGATGITTTDGTFATFPLYEGVSAEDAAAQGRVMVGPALARTLDLRPGDTFEVAGRTGPVTLTVGGVWAAPDNLGRSITLRRDLFEQLVGPRPADRVALVPEPGVPLSKLAADIEAAHLADNLRVWTPEQLGADLAEDFKTFTAPFWVISRGLLMVAFIAAASTLLLAGVKRRAEHGLLAAVGMAPGDLGRMVLVEAGLFGLFGTIAGFIGGILSLAAFSLSSTTMTGLAIGFNIQILPLIVYGGIATALVLAGAALPAYRTSQLDPVIALRYE